MANKILLIRMLGFGDVTCIGIPALRHLRQKFPDAELHMLTYAAGEEVIKLAMPDVKVYALKKGEWPEDIVGAMQVFMGLAEDILGEEYSQIINLDTWFMPCFLARFLKDAGEPVSGNTISLSITELVDGLQNQTLSPDYVNFPSQYMQSSWLSMAQWHTPWWEHGTPPELGYPEFYLRRCCGFGDIAMDMQINIPADEYLLSQQQPIVALNTQARTQERCYPYTSELVSLLEAEGVLVWQGFDGSEPLSRTLAKLKASQLLVTVPSAPQWLATTVNTPSLVITGHVDPRTLMPDYATEMSDTPVEPASIAAGVIAILSEK